MLQISPKIRAQFDTMLIEKNIPKSAHTDYRKWLRYYLDFCHKYHFDNSKKESLPHFIKKIKDKRQNMGRKRGDVAIFVSFIFQLFHDDSYDKYIL